MYTEYDYTECNWSIDILLQYFASRNTMRPRCSTFPRSSLSPWDFCRCLNRSGTSQWLSNRPIGRSSATPQPGTSTTRRILGTFTYIENFTLKLSLHLHLLAGLLQFLQFQWVFVLCKSFVFALSLLARGRREGSLQRRPQDVCICSLVSVSPCIFWWGFCSF